MAKVRAAYNYSYNYEGQKISFKKDEEFQLLSKSNKDWWQVRRWMEGSAQDIYVPAVYVREVQDQASVANNEPDPTYMNLDDIKLPPKSGESNGAGSKGGATSLSGSGGVGSLGNVLPIVRSKPERNSGKKNSLEKNDLGIDSSSGNSSVTESSSSVKTNGLGPAAPSVLQRLSRPSPATGISTGSATTTTGAVTTTTTPPATGGTAFTSRKSFKKGGDGNPPPVASSKPRAKSNADGTQAAADAIVIDFNRQTSTGAPGPAVKIKVPPPILSKPKPLKAVTTRRPVSCMHTGSEVEGLPGGGVGVSGGRSSPLDVLEGNKPNVSQLSSLLMKKNPHLAEHKTLGKTMSSGANEGIGPSRGGVGVGGVGGISDLDRSLDARSPLPSTEAVKPPQSNGTASPPGAPPSPVLPAGWTEHKTNSGQTYYYNTASGQSSWTRPKGEGGVAENQYLEKVAPRGWTKEINPITSTPIYTNSRTGERWSLASDGKGNYYYYNMANSSLTVGELPDICEAPKQEEEGLYDTLLPVVPKGPPSSSSTTTPAAVHASGSSLTNNALITETIASSLADVLRRHGYLHRKRQFDSHGKKAKDRGWLKFYVLLQQYELLFYHDLKSKDSGGKPSAVFCLLQSNVSPYNKDRKKVNVFQVSSHLGEQFLLQAETANLMNEWYSTIQTSIDQANRDFRENPERFKSVLVEPIQEDAEGSPKLGSLRRDKKISKTGLSRNQSVSDEGQLEDEEEMMVDNMEISAADRSTHIRGRLRRLMARRPEKDQLKSKGILEDPVFGCELTTLCEREGGTVPIFFTQFMQHIEKHGLDVVGIYRLSGNAASVNKLRYLVEQATIDQQIDLSCIEWSDVNIITGCLKLYLRELPDPLIPFKLYKPLIEAARASTHAQRVQNIATRIKDLPTANYYTFKALIQHLKRVVEMGHVNKMLATNVAIVFGPTVMRAETDSLEMATLMPIQNGIVEIMVNEFDSIFRK